MSGVGVDPGRLRGVGAKDLGLRFAFGAVIAIVAGAVSLRFGPRVGGVFLAFPAILPASLTLVEQREGRTRASADARGGQVGGVGMVAFAVAATWLLSRAGAGPALVMALLAWMAVAAGLYLLVRRLWPLEWEE